MSSTLLATPKMRERLSRAAAPPAPPPSAPKLNRLDFWPFTKMTRPGAAPEPEVPAATVDDAKAPSDHPSARLAGRKRLWLARRARVYMQMRKSWPHLFCSEPPIPLAINIHVEIAAALGLSKADRTALHAILRQTVRRASYLRAVATADSVRFDLNGRPVEAVSDEHREAARSALEQLQGRSTE